MRLENVKETWEICNHLVACQAQDLSLSPRDTCSDRRWQLRVTCISPTGFQHSGVMTIQNLDLQILFKSNRSIIVPFWHWLKQLKAHSRQLEIWNQMFPDWYPIQEIGVNQLKHEAWVWSMRIQSYSFCNRPHVVWSVYFVCLRLLILKWALLINVHCIIRQNRV